MKTTAAETVAKLKTAIARYIADENVKAFDLDFMAYEVEFYHCFPFTDEFLPHVSLDTDDLRKVYAALVAERLGFPDFFDTVLGNRNDMWRRDGRMIHDKSGNYESIAYVCAAAMASVQWARWQEEYEVRTQEWEETFAEAGSDHVFGGGDPHDANTVAHDTAGPKPRKFWITSEAA